MLPSGPKPESFNLFIILPVRAVRLIIIRQSRSIDFGPSPAEAAVNKKKQDAALIVLDLIRSSQRMSRNCPFSQTEVRPSRVPEMRLPEPQVDVPDTICLMVWPKPAT